MILADLSPRLRRERVTIALECVLQGLAAPAGTYELAEDIARVLGSKELELIGRLLADLAPDHPAAAKSSATFKRFGRTFQRWVWSPAGTSAAAPSEAKPEAGPLIRCPHCNEREFPHNITPEGRCPACVWEV